MRKTKPLAVTVAGVRVSVHFDDQGRPLFANAGIERPGDLAHERVVTLAATTAFEAALSGWQGAKRKASSDKATAESARRRAQRSEQHWANEWFALAHAAHPKYGKDRLAQHARALAAAADDKAKKPEDKIPAKKRDEITVERARAFLERVRNAPQQ